VTHAEAIEYLSREVQRTMGSSLAKLVLYGRIAAGKAGEGSDIDMAAIHFGEARTVLQKVSDIALETAPRYGEVIECIPISVHGFRTGARRSFLREVGRGRVLFEMDEKEAITQEARGYLMLAGQYRSYAKGALERGENRAAIDLGYNGAELLVKALIPARGGALTQTHGVLLQQLGRMYVRGGILGRSVGAELHNALILRSKARYDPTTHLVREEAEDVLRLIETLATALSRELPTR